MYFSSFTFLATVLTLSSVQSKDDSLTPFGEKVKACIPEKTKTIIFNQNYKDLEEIEKTEKILPKTFTEAIGGPPLDPCLVKQINAVTTRLLKSANECGLFQGYVTANYEFLKHIGKLNSSNVDSLAEAFVKALNEAVKTVPDNYSLINTLPALLTGEAKFLKSQKITPEENANKFIEYLKQGLNKAAKTAPDDDSHDSIK